jgi:hypothetical protein
VLVTIDPAQEAGLGLPTSARTDPESGRSRLVDLANESEALTAKLAVKAKAETAVVEEADKGLTTSRAEWHRHRWRRWPQGRGFDRMAASRAGVTQLAECLLPKRSVTSPEG